MEPIDVANAIKAAGACAGGLALLLTALERWGRRAAREHEKRALHAAAKEAIATEGNGERQRIFDRLGAVDEEQTRQAREMRRLQKDLTEITFTLRRLERQQPPNVTGTSD